MPKKWVTLKEYVKMCGKHIVFKSFGLKSESALNNYLYKGTEPCGSVKILAHKFGVKEWWIGEVPIPPKIKRHKKDIDTTPDNKPALKEPEPTEPRSVDDILGDSQ